MTTRETDTSASEAGTDRTDSDELFDRLVAEGVLAVENGGDRVRTTDDFDDTHAVYHDSYVGVSDDEFHEAVAATFGLPDPDAAAELVEARGVTREELVCYLAVRSHLDAGPDARGETVRNGTDLSSADLAKMAEMVAAVVPDSPVPAAVADVTDDPAGFLAGRDRAVVSVWKRFCDPCDALKDDLGAVLDAVPDDAAVAGLDGEVATEFCETHGVESAPGFVLFREGEAVRTVTGGDTAAVVEALRSTYSD